MRRTNYYYPEPMLAALKRMSAKVGTPVSELIRRAIAEFLKRNKA